MISSPNPYIELDSPVSGLIDVEAEHHHIILIPSESSVPAAVRQAVGSVFHNIYAEGYPDDAWRAFSQSEILDIDIRLAEFRRELSDRRYYKGTEFADIIESLARRRAAEAFATEEFPAERRWDGQRPAAEWFAGQQRRLRRADQARRHDHGHGPAARRSPDARQPGQPQRFELYNVVSYYGSIRTRSG